MYRTPLIHLPADATGYNAEAGIRGKIFRYLQYDVSVFTLLYKNRMGTLVLQDNNGQPYTYRTNIGDSRTTGVELFVQYKFPLSNNLYAGVFTSTSYMNGEYINGQVSSGAGNKSIFNKQYFTKRPTMYPGPGIWPSDGRNAYVTVGIKI